MIATILEKLLFKGQTVSEEERLILLDWFRRTESAASKTNPLTGRITPGIPQSDITAMVEEALKSRQWINNLAEISNKTGLQIAGEFRTGNGKTPGDGFTGGRFGYPGFTYGGTEYFLVGVSNDVLQVGLSLADGKIIFGGGDGWLDQFGLTFANQEGFVQFLDTSGGGTMQIYADGFNDLVLKNAFGGEGIRFDIDDASHNVVGPVFTANGILIDGFSTDINLSVKVNEPTTFNDGNIDIDVFFRGTTDDNLLMIDAGLNAIGIGGAALSGQKVTVYGGLHVNESAADVDSHIEGTTDANLTYWDASLNGVGIGTTPASGYKLRVSGNVRVIGGLALDEVLNASGLAAGTYAPTCTAVANVDATSAVANFTYMRVGNSVVVSGNLNADATALGAAQIRVTVPVASDFTSTGDLSGIGGVQGSDDVVVFLADTVNNACDVSWTANGTANTVIRFVFMYVVK